MQRQIQTLRQNQEKLIEERDKAIREKLGLADDLQQAVAGLEKENEQLVSEVVTLNGQLEELGGDDARLRQVKKNIQEKEGKLRRQLTEEWKHELAKYMRQINQLKAQQRLANRLPEQLRQEIDKLKDQVKQGPQVHKRSLATGNESCRGRKEVERITAVSQEK